MTCIWLYGKLNEKNISNIYLYVHFQTFWKKPEAQNKIISWKQNVGLYYDSMVCLTKVILLRFIKSPSLVDESELEVSIEVWQGFKSGQFFQTYLHLMKRVISESFNFLNVLQQLMHFIFNLTKKN